MSAEEGKGNWRGGFRVFKLRVRIQGAERRKLARIQACSFTTLHDSEEMRRTRLDAIKARTPPRRL